MKTKAIILAGGEGTRLGVLTAKRTKPAVTFAGKYRIIDFTLSNCVNSGIFDVMIIAQYRPHSLIEHIGAGGPWDLNRDFTGGVRIYTPYKAFASDWFIGTADAVQQNFAFIKRGEPDYVLILSGDHIYSMDYCPMIAFHEARQADLTIASIRVPKKEASRFGIMGVDEESRVISFVEKPENPPSDTANMGVYLFKKQVLNDILWEDHLRKDSYHDFGKDILPAMVANGMKVYAYPFDNYWVDVGTLASYWHAHMDLLAHPPVFNLFDRSWVIHTRTEERPPVNIQQGALVEDSLICDGCIIEAGARVIRSVLSPGVIVAANSVVRESIVLTDSVIQSKSVLERAIIDKRVLIGNDVHIGAQQPDSLTLSMIGKNAVLPDGLVVEAGGVVGVDVHPEDFPRPVVSASEVIQTRRLPYEI